MLYLYSMFIACNNSYTSLNPRTFHLQSHLIFTTPRKVHHCVSSITVARLGFDVHAVLLNISAPCNILFWFVLESPGLAVLSLPQLTALLIFFPAPFPPSPPFSLHPSLPQEAGFCGFYHQAALPADFQWLPTEFTPVYTLCFSPTPRFPRAASLNYNFCARWPLFRGFSPNVS